MERGLHFPCKQAKSAGPCERLRPAIHSQLGEDVAHVALDRNESQHQPLGNLLVGSPFLHQVQHLQFAPTQGVEQGWLRAQILIDSSFFSLRAILSSCSTPHLTLRTLYPTHFQL